MTHNFWFSEFTTCTDQCPALCHLSPLSWALVRFQSTPQAAKERTLVAAVHCFLPPVCISTYVPPSSPLSGASHCSSRPASEIFLKKTLNKAQFQKFTFLHWAQDLSALHPHTVHNFPWAEEGTNVKADQLDDSHAIYPFLKRDCLLRPQPSALMSSLHPSLSSGGSQG